MTTNDNTLIRSEPCPVCGERLLWTQSTWREPGLRSATSLERAAYRCANGHVVDPAETPQCPACGIHDTSRTDAPNTFVCHRCSERFTVPR
jgi:hypothetical protein